MRFMLDRSYFAFTSAGSAVIILTSAGAENVEVTLYFSTRRSQSSASNLRWMITVCPSASPIAMNEPGPLWYSGPEVM